MKAPSVNAEVQTAVPANLKATDAQINAAYAATGSVWLASEQLGMCGQSVHERLVKLGTIKPINVFTAEDAKYLKDHYTAYVNSGKLNELAAKMGRTRQFLCRQAKALGLTDRKRDKPYISTWKYMPVDAAQVIWDDFKDTKLGLVAYCKKKGYDDLGFAKRMRELFYDEWDHVMELKKSKQTLYRLGRAFEYRVRDHLKAAGYFVMRSPQSKTPVDLLAVAAGIALFVQCKRGGLIGVQEWNSLYNLARKVSAKPILAMMDPKRAQGVSLFEMTDKKDGTKRAQPMVPFHV